MEKLAPKPLPNEISRPDWLEECCRQYQKFRIESDLTRGQLQGLEISMFHFLNLMRRAQDEEKKGSTVRFIKDEEGGLSFVIERR